MPQGVHLLHSWGPERRKMRRQKCKNRKFPGPSDTSAQVQRQEGSCRDESRRVEGAKFERFAAAVPVVGEEKEMLLAEDHVVIPSQWVDVDKNEHLKGKKEYVPRMKSRLVSCGNFEKGKEELRSDSPTSDLETHHIVACWAVSKRAVLRSADVTSAYFQAMPLDRVLLMRLPRGGLPGVDPEALLLVRLPIYGLSDSGRGFWLRLDKEA